MKTKILAAIAFAAVFGITCSWFRHKNDEAGRSSLLAGRYEVISITDSSIEQKPKPNDTLKWFFNSPLKDSLQRYLNFSNDSLIIYEATNQADSGKYYADTTNKIVYIKNDSTYQPLNVIQKSDSTINLVAANDSVYIALKKL